MNKMACVDPECNGCHVQISAAEVWEQAAEDYRRKLAIATEALEHISEYTTHDRRVVAFEALAKIRGPMSVEATALELQAISERCRPDTQKSRVEPTVLRDPKEIDKAARDWHTTWVDSDDCYLLANEFGSRKWDEEYVAAYAAGFEAGQVSKGSKEVAND